MTAATTIAASPMAKKTLRSCRATAAGRRGAGQPDFMSDPTGMVATVRWWRRIGRSILMGGGVQEEAQKAVLIVLFIPSVERDGVTPIDQDAWVDSALVFFGSTFGGATAFPKARGIWRDDERGGALVRDEPVVMQCYVATEQLDDPRLDALRGFCSRLGRETRQGEIGVVIDGNYIAIRNFEEDGT
jgi:hypothetical protein